MKRTKAIREAGLCAFIEARLNHLLPKVLAQIADEASVQYPLTDANKVIGTLADAIASGDRRAIESAARQKSVMCRAQATVSLKR